MAPSPRFPAHWEILSTAVVQCCVLVSGRMAVKHMTLHSREAVYRVLESVVQGSRWLPVELTGWRQAHHARDVYFYYCSWFRYVQYAPL